MFSPRATGLQPKQYARPFDQNLGSPLIYFFYMHTTIRQKYMVLFHLIFLLCTTIQPKIKVHTDLFLYMYTTIRPKIRVHIDLFFYLHTTIRPNYRVLFQGPHSTKLQGPFILFFLQCTTIRPKIKVFIDIFLSFAHDHSTKIYDLLCLIYSFFVHDHLTEKQLIYCYYLFTTIRLSQVSLLLFYLFFSQMCQYFVCYIHDRYCPYDSIALFLSVLHLYFVRYVHSITTLIFRTLNSLGRADTFLTCPFQEMTSYRHGYSVRNIKAYFVHYIHGHMKSRAKSQKSKFLRKST